MKKEIIAKASLVMCLVLFLMSCSSNKQARKCNGERGIKTNMGTM